MKINILQNLSVCTTIQEYGKRIDASKYNKDNNIHIYIFGLYM